MSTVTAFEIEWTREEVLAVLGQSPIPEVVTVNPFTHCPCQTSTGAVCGLKFREGECCIHTSYADSMVIIAAQQAWKVETK